MSTLPNREEIWRTWEETHLVKRFGRPEEVVSLALWLATDDAGFMTGAALPIDGGLLRRLTPTEGAGMSSTTTRSVSVPSISAETALALVEAAAAKAEKLGKQMAVAVCDPAGVLKAFVRMDGAALLAVELAQNKAYTAVSFGISTDSWHDFIKDDPPLALGIVHTPRLVVFGGGYPIKENEQVIGAIGVSGGHYTDDMECARGGLEALGFSID